jgi:hypothetical protein
MGKDDLQRPESIARMNVSLFILFKIFENTHGSPGPEVSSEKDGAIPSGFAPGFFVSDFVAPSTGSQHSRHAAVDGKRVTQPSQEWSPKFSTSIPKIDAKPEFVRARCGPNKSVNKLLARFSRNSSPYCHVTPSIRLIWRKQTRKL